MANTGCVIYRGIDRPPQKLIDAFRGIPVANIDDCMNRIAAISSEIKPVGPSGLCGPALTVKVAEGDNLMLHKALDLARPGDVIVVDAGGCMHRSIMGGLMARYAMLRGLGGIVIDGCIRDYDELRSLSIPIYARGITPNGPYKNGPGEINTPIACGGRPVFPGDLVVGDGDGVLFLRRSEAERILRDVQALMRKEADIVRVQDQTGTYDRPWVDEKLSQLGAEILDVWTPGP